MTGDGGDSIGDGATADMGAEGDDVRRTSRNNGHEVNTGTGEPGGVKSRGSVLVETGGVASDPGGPFGAKAGRNRNNRNQ